MTRRPFFRDQRVAVWVGAVALTVGALALHDAYERRGKQRPFLTRLLPAG